MTKRVAVTLALALFVFGCEESDDRVRLLTGTPPNMGGGGCFTNWAEGQLITDPNGTAIAIDAGSTMTMMWRRGFSARRVGLEVEVLDPLGNVVATTGRRYRIDGGSVGGESSSAQLPIGVFSVFWACDRVTELR